MSNSYIGINDVARKITGGYIGVNGIARKIAKAYIGDENGLAKLIYQPQNIITFNSSIAPTSWTEITTGTEYTATNTYGEWTISASEYNSGSYAFQSFDGNDSTSWRPANMADSTVYAWIQQLFPIPINPSVIRIKSVYSNKAKLQLLQTNDTWIDVQNLTRTTSAGIETINCNYNQYFKGMRIYGQRYGSSYKYFRVYEFDITSGTGLM